MIVLSDNPNAAANPRYSNETFTGHFVDLSNPQPHQFDLEGVAAGLSKVCRYAAGPKFYFCVAEHAYWVSKRVEWIGLDVDIQLGALHHDDAEFVMGDVSTPMKRYLADREAEKLAERERAVTSTLTARLGGRIDPDEADAIIAEVSALFEPDREAILKELEERLMRAIIPGLGFYPGEIDLTHPAIKNADLWALAGEAKQLTASGGEGWTEIGEYDPHPDLSSFGLSPERAKALWIERHHELLAKLRRLPAPARHV